jgi:iron complex outermembrane receptor protein
MTFKNHLRKARLFQAIVTLALAAGAFPAFAADDGTTNAPAGTLADLSVEQLMNESVTSVARRETKFEDSAAAISVITQDDIRRLGITTIPDALRLVPGLDVAQINSHEWAVSVRGFNGEFANKLLVLVDGRSIYSTGFGGVVWGMEDVPLEDVDRIEVIRGPGASLWGANAVNGVINIITKSAKDTQGVLISVTGGTFDQPTTTVRYGTRLATNLFCRVYAKVSNRDGLETAGGQAAPDRTFTAQGGTRLDWEPSDEDKVTLQGDFFRDRFVENQDYASLSPPYVQSFNQVSDDSGGNVLGRWTHDFSDSSSLAIQTYYDRFKEEQAGASETADTFDFDAQHRFMLGNRNDITWGLGYRGVAADFTSSPFVMWSQTTEHDELYSSFVQDEISLLPDRLKLTLGSKFEDNSLSGLEVEPTVRLLWTPTARQSVWAAISRAVRTPDWTDLHADVNVQVLPPTPALPLPVLLSALGNPKLDTEELTAYELGYRVELTKHLSLDAAAFYDDYGNLIAPIGTSTQIETGASPPYVSVTSPQENAGPAHTYGLEISARWDATDYWHLTANYSWLDTQLGFYSPDTQPGPRQQAQLRSSLDLPCRLELNGDVSFVDQVAAPYGMGQMNIPSYVRLDLGLVWHATRNLELGVWGENLAQARHVEYTSYTSTLVTEIPRGVFGRITIRF